MTATTSAGTRRRQALVAAAFPLICIVGFLLLMGLWAALDLPSADVVYDWLILHYQRHGLLIVAVAALMEGLVMINIYLPGSAVVLVAVSTSRGNPFLAAAIVATASASLLVAAQLNYAVGYFGLHSLISRLGGKKWLENAGSSYEAYGAFILLPSYVHPSVGSFMSVTCGIARLPWRRFFPLATVAIVLWTSLWGVLAYVLADAVRYVATNPFAVIVGLAVWAFVAGIYSYVRIGKVQR